MRWSSPIFDRTWLYSERLGVSLGIGLCLSHAGRVKVFAGIQRRRRYSLDQKPALLEKAAQPGMMISYVVRRYGISPNLIFGQAGMAEGGNEAVRAYDKVLARA
jgi:hypothetical protein